MNKFTSALFMSMFIAGSAMAQTNLLSNASFEEWDGSNATNWVSTTTASNGTVEKSTDARTGSASILLKGTSSGNKRIAYKEITLKAGTYEFSIYAKGATAEAGSARPGYAPVNEDGSMGQYVYGEYYNDLANADWALVSYTFELAEQTKLNLVVMNSKNPGKDLLFDDASLTTTNGGIVEDGGSTEPDPTENIIFETSFNNGDAAGFEFKDVELGGLEYVWKADSYGYLKASAYTNETGTVATESWAISPTIDLSTVKEATMVFRHTMNKMNGGEPKDYGTLYVSDNYTGDVKTATWNEITITTYPDGNNWNFVDAGEFDLKSYCGKKVVFGFKYVSTAESAPTWEIDNLKISSPIGSGIEVVEDVNAPVEVYTINGVMVGNSLEGLESGLYLVKQGNKVRKVIK